MKKYRSILVALSFMILTFILTTATVHAEDDDVYFVNMNGVELNKQQYENLASVFSEDTIKTMAPALAEDLKNETTLTKVTTTKYVKVEYTYEDGKVVSTKDAEVTKDEYDNSDEIIRLKEEKSTAKVSMFNQDKHETAYKIINLDIVTPAWPTEKLVTLTNKWKQLPSYRSFDVLAIGVEKGTALTQNLDSTTFSGYQNWDGNVINYNSSSNNKKIVDGTGIYKKGIGLSQNLVDAATNSITNSMTIKFVNGSDPFKVRGSYQHATANVSLNQSKNYTLGTNGMGGLIDFSSSVSQYYDNTQGVSATCNGIC